MVITQYTIYIQIEKFSDGLRKGSVNVVKYEGDRVVMVNFRYWNWMFNHLSFRRERERVTKDREWLSDKTHDEIREVEHESIWKRVYKGLSKIPS